MIQVRIIIGILIMIFSIKGIAQEDISLISFRDTIYYDQNSGNYLCYYQSNEQIIEVIFEPKTKIEPRVKSEVYYNPNNYNFLYNYTLFNSSVSKQRLYVFDLRIFSNIDNIIKPSAYWKTSYYSFTPIFGWAHSIGKAGITHPFNGIAPDSSLSNFGFSSYGLPSINDAYFQGNAMIPLAIPDDGNERIVELLKPHRKFPNNSVICKTIGPKDPPNPFIQSEFTDTLLNYNSQSLELNWIKDEQTYLKYNTLLTKAKNNLEQNDSNFAKVYLQEVIKNTIEDSSSVLTSEAFALLYFNIEYLVNQLPEINIADMFERLIVEIEECKLSGSITNKGIYNSLKKKAENAKKSYEKDNIHSSVQKLNAFQNELRAQKDKHISIECTETLDEYSEIIIELLEE